MICLHSLVSLRVNLGSILDFLFFVFKLYYIKMLLLRSKCTVYLVLSHCFLIEKKVLREHRCTKFSFNLSKPRTAVMHLN